MFDDLLVARLRFTSVVLRERMGSFVSIGNSIQRHARIAGGHRHIRIHLCDYHRSLLDEMLIGSDRQAETDAAIGLRQRGLYYHYIGTDRSTTPHYTRQIAQAQRHETDLAPVIFLEQRPQSRRGLPGQVMEVLAEAAF